MKNQSSFNISTQDAFILILAFSTVVIGGHYSLFAKEDLPSVAIKIILNIVVIVTAYMLAMHDKQSKRSYDLKEGPRSHKLLWFTAVAVLCMGPVFTGHMNARYHLLVLMISSSVILMHCALWLEVNSVNKFRDTSFLQHLQKKYCDRVRLIPLEQVCREDFSDGMYKLFKKLNQAQAREGFLEVYSLPGLTPNEAISEYKVYLKNVGERDIHCSVANMHNRAKESRNVKGCYFSTRDSKDRKTTMHGVFYNKQNGTLVVFDTLADHDNPVEVECHA